MNVIDVRRVLKAIKGLSLDLNSFDETLRKIAQQSSRLCCIFETFDPYSDEAESSGTSEVVPDYDSDDLTMEVCLLWMKKTVTKMIILAALTLLWRH